MNNSQLKMVLDVSNTGYIPPINTGPLLSSRSAEQSDSNLQHESIKPTPKRDTKSTIPRPIFCGKDQCIKQRIPFHYVFSKHNTRSIKHLHTPGAPAVGVGRKKTDAHLQPVSPHKTGIREQAALNTGTSVITFGSPLSLRTLIDGVNVSTSHSATRRLGIPLSSFNSSQAHFSNEAHKNCQDLSIEGVRTGEESVIEISESHKTKESTSQASVSSSQEELRLRLCKVKSECKILTDRLQKKNTEIKKIRAIFDLYIEAGELRSQIEWNSWAERDKLTHFFVQKIHQASHATSMQLKADYASQINQLHNEAQRLKQELEGFRSMKEEFKLREEQIRDDIVDEREKLKKEIEQLRSEIEGQRTAFAHEKEQLGIEIAESQDAQRRLADQLRNVKNELAEEGFMIQQCRIFLKQICQPSFHVVKGASLEPVEPNRPEPTGFVLIPLVVLLHGYSLLPVKEREDVIRQYEQKSSELSGL